jgi:phage tail sheath protein FI
VTKNDIVGGVDPATNARTGIELLPEVFLKFQKIPCFGLAPGWSHIPEVAILLRTKMKKLGYGFTGIALTDLPTKGTYANYRNLPQWKNLNGYVDPNQFADWPCGKIGDRVFHASTLLAGAYGVVDNGNDGLPFEQVSNKIAPITGMCDEDGNTITMLDDEQANYLNENGIGTFINFAGWRFWGVETTAYPGNTDIKDYERSVRRMFCHTENVVNRTFRQEVDKPARRLLIDKALGTGNEYMNALRGRQAINGGLVLFTREDNPNINIIGGELKFKVQFTPPNAAKAITLDWVYNPDFLKSLF